MMYVSLWEDINFILKIIIEDNLPQTNLILKLITEKLLSIIEYLVGISAL